MNPQSSVLQGRNFGPVELQQVRDLLAAQPSWSRWRLSRALAEQWAWRTARGLLKDMAARTLLLTLERRGLIVLPPCRVASPNRMRHKRPPSADLLPPGEPLSASLSELTPLQITEVSAPAQAPQRAIFEAALHRYHYLSYRSAVGENLQYLVHDRHGRLLACALFGAAAWQCAARDRFIGWSAVERAGGLSGLANQARFLILPWVRVPQLASHGLAQLTRRLSGDWSEKYGHPVWLVETFVEIGRFAGTCYRAANWVEVGATTGRSRQTLAQAVPRKAVFVYPLHPQFRARLVGVNSVAQARANSLTRATAVARVAHGAVEALAAADAFGTPTRAVGASANASAVAPARAGRAQLTLNLVAS